MKIQKDGSMIFTARSGNQAVITMKVSADQRTSVADIAWNRKESPSDRRECEKAFVKHFPGFRAISALGSYSESERRAITAHALTHGGLPDGVEAEAVKGVTPRKEAHDKAQGD